MDDPDAPRPQPWVHWVLYHIRGDVTSLPEGIPADASLSAPPGGRHGKNTWDRLGYGGPAPPKGHGTHHYHFRVYALDAPISLDAGKTKEEVLEAIRRHVIAEGETIGTYERK
jgi:Raf kinase inhibitor-like YbhB/YbcL family protein